MRKIALSMLLSVVFAVPAFSQMDMSMMEHGEQHGQMMEMGNMEMMDKMGDMSKMCLENADKIGLTDDQFMKMRQGHIEMKKKQARFKADLKIAELELAEIMEVKDFNLEKATSAVNKLAGIKTSHQLEMLNAMKEMRSILTDDQFNKIKKMMTKKMGEKKPMKKIMKMKK